MMKRLLSAVLTATMALAFVVGASTKADASFVLDICSVQFCSGGTVIIVGDNLAGDLNPIAGRITAFEGGVGGFNAFDVESALTYPAVGSPANPQLDITYQASGTGSVWLYAFADGYTGVGGVTLKNNGNTTGGTATSLLSLYGGNSNVLGDISHLIISLAGFNGATSGPFTPTANPYSLVLELHLTQTGTGALTTGDANASIPEPTSMAVFGLGMLGAGIAARRRRRA